MAALVSGIAVAQAKIKLNYRTQATFAEIDPDEGTATLFNQKSASAQDTLEISISTDTAGVLVAFAPMAGQLYADATSSIKFLNAYNGWMKFDNLTINAGSWKDGVFFANRCNADAGNWIGSGKYFEYNKIGIINGAIGKAIDSLVHVNGSEGNLSFYADYVLNNVLPGNLTFRASVITQDTDFFTEDEDVTMKDALGALIAYEQPGVFQAEIVGKWVTEDQMTYGIYFNPLMNEALTMTFGGAVGLDTSKTSDNVEYGIDLRARYAFTKKISATTMHNFSVSQDDVQQLWNMINAKLILTDSLAVQCGVQHQNKAFESNDAGSEIRIMPSVLVSPGKGAVISIGFEYVLDNVGADADSITKLINVPVTFRVKL
jgi:hypothetical protein